MAEFLFRMNFEIAMIFFYDLSKDCASKKRFLLKTC